MATVDKTGCGPTAGTITFNGLNRVYVATNTIDLTSGAITQGDVYQCLALPEDTLVMRVTIEWVTAAVGTTLTVDVGDGTTADGWDASVDGKSAAGTWTTSTVATDTYAVAASMGKFYEAADSIDMTMTTATAITAGPKFRIFALCVDMNPNV